MKKILSLGMLFLIAMVTLTACLEWEGPPGFDYDFHTNAENDFAEIDDDTSEGESPDRDDLGNFKRHAREADTEQEKEYVALMEQLIEENKKIVADIDYPTDKYEEIREQIGNVLDIHVYEFEFTDGEDE
jgi:hypothetical protein